MHSESRTPGAGGLRLQLEGLIQVETSRAVYSGSPIRISKSQFSLYAVREHLASIRSTLPDFSPRSMAHLGRHNAEPSSTRS